MSMRPGMAKGAYVGIAGGAAYTAGPGIDIAGDSISARSNHYITPDMFDIPISSLDYMQRYSGDPTEGLLLPGTYNLPCIRMEPQESHWFMYASVPLPGLKDGVSKVETWRMHATLHVLDDYTPNYGNFSVTMDGAVRDEGDTMPPNWAAPDFTETVIDPIDGTGEQLRYYRFNQSGLGGTDGFLHMRLKFDVWYEIFPFLLFGMRVQFHNVA